MAIDKARKFLENLLDNPQMVEQMKGFTVDDMKMAAEELKKEGKINDKNTLLAPDAI